MTRKPLDVDFIIKMIKKAPKDVYNIKGNIEKSDGSFEKMTLMELGESLGNEKIIKRLKEAGADQYWSVTGN